MLSSCASSILAGSVWPEKRPFSRTLARTSWLALLAWPVLGVPLAVGALVAAAMVVRPRSVKAGTMGLSRARGLKHGLMQVDPAASFGETMAKGRLKELWKSVQRTYRRSGIECRSRSLRWLGWRHVQIIWQHERRYGYSIPRACVALAIRYVSFCVCSDDTLDEFVLGDRLVAFASSVAKGNCIRAMWYYSSNEAAKSCVFHFAVAGTVWRALQLGIAFIDVGPSPRKVREAKEKLGFEFRSDYASHYEGDFRPVPPIGNTLLAN